MSYFPHSYKKVFIGSYFMTEGTTMDLEGGGVGFFDPRTWMIIAPGDADVATYPEVVLVQGSYRNSDSLGPYGGYKESAKSKPIGAHNVERFWKVTAASSTNQVVSLGWDGTNASTAPKFLCGENYSLRIDLRGAPAVRFLGQNFYRRFDVSTDCCVDGEDPQAVDPVEVLLEFAKQINADPVLSQFVSADVLDGGGFVNAGTYDPLTDEADIAAATGTLRLNVGYSPTRFYCSFDVNDFSDNDRVYISSAQLVDESGNACSDFKQLNFKEDIASWGGRGTGRQILYDLILSDSYRQDFLHPSVRRREVEGNNFLDMPVLQDLLTPSLLWDSYYILYSVPRRSNPSGVYDNDRYVVQLTVPGGNDMTDFETWMGNYLASANTGVELEDLS